MRLEQAIELARRFHEGQFDKSGRPYLEHILRVVDGVQTDDEKLVAAMHDLVEDTPLSFGDLICAGAPHRIVQAVESLTKQANEDYIDFIARAAGDPIARPVKLADLADNADEARLALLEPELAARLRTKYSEALGLLLSLEPLSEAEYAAARSARTGTPVGATELGKPQDPSEMWATFWCDEGGCGRPSSTLSLVPVKNPDVFVQGGYWLELDSFLGTTGNIVKDEQLASVRAALTASDSSFFIKLNWELAPFWCPKCQRNYCSSHWEVETVVDEGFFDCFRGTCPRGHERELWD
jgi:hypothetical protein